MPNPDLSHFAGCLIGQCLGDALGFIVEGAGPAVCQSYVDQVVRTGNTADQTRGHFRFGQYSDDSQLARELILSLVECGRLDPADYAARVCTIFREGRIVGRGIASDQAAKRLAIGVPWDKAGAPAPSAGNGTAMRAAPIGLFFFDRMEELIRAAHDQGRITHHDPRCSAGSVTIAAAVALVLRAGPLSPPGFVRQLSELARPFDSTMADALLEMPRWLRESPAAVVPEISQVGIPHGFNDGWTWISPFVTSSVLWSLYAFLRSPDDYMESICTAIVVGGDVDTTAAMTGALSGAYLGLDRIPAHLACQVNDAGTWGYDDLVDLASRCHGLAVKGTVP